MEEEDKAVSFGWKTMDINGELTGDQDETGPCDVLPECLVVAGGEPLHEIIVPRDIDSHVTGQSVSNEDGKGQHSLHHLGHAARKRIGLLMKNY